jgi:tetratricopeptide (TPR) repeat protein
MALLFACVHEAPPPAAQAAVAAVDSLAAAIAAIDQRIVNDPGNAALYAERSVLRSAQDSLRLAAADMERALAIDSANVEHLLRAGDLHYALVDVEKARSRFVRAMELAPEDTRPRLKLAEIELVLRRYKEGMALVNEALRRDPNNAQGYYLKGWIHMEAGDTALSISSFRTAVEQDPGQYDAYLMLGKLSAARHDPLAEQYYRSAIDLRPGSAEPVYNLGVYYQDHGADSAALACYAYIKEVEPKNPLPWYNSGWVLLELRQDPAAAKAEFSKAIDLETNYPDAWYNRGVAMERTGELDSAAANYQVCLRIRPDHGMAAIGLERLARQGVRIKVPKDRK